ncbi:hypothetical protein L1049_027143 [Liquidambar formosana]|uniref:F-box domain-containing protein n=1 Tax=Liquidambar formosana TaxID=63359 RepID=A0AAP0N966_LIQFO
MKGYVGDKPFTQKVRETNQRRSTLLWLYSNLHPKFLASVLLASYASMGTSFGTLNENQENSVEGNNNKTNDHISELPEDILSHILSFLPVRDAAKARVLSPRWRYLCASTSNLNFDLFTIFGINDTMKYHSYSYNFWESKLKFINTVDKVLQLSGSKVDSFRICYSLGNGSACHIDRWISFAVRMQTEKIELDFYFLSRDKTYNFPCHLLPPGKISQLKHLCLKLCMLRLPHDFADRFNSLKTLDLDIVILDQNFCESILSACINLEWLRLVFCRLPVSFRICGKCVHLKFLVLEFCEGAKTFELSSLALTTFEYIGRDTNFTFIDVPSLRKVHINSGYDFESNEFAKDLSQLQILSLMLYTWEGQRTLRIPANMTKFSRLKQLKLFLVLTLDFDLLSVRFILNASPHLQKFHLGLHYQRAGKGQMKKKEDIKHIYHQLKEIKISGFSDRWIVKELVKYLLNNAVSLERMIVDTQASLYEGNGLLAAGLGRRQQQ